ncbi:hypothetical protein RIF29_21137 [Crotalaria pallida]|uniref:RNase H type-1 domain-containing protein n=1 Tax=Crotalaria pallida TaxID=3830 RepID=A0AAN9F2H2_CROPI
MIESISSKVLQIIWKWRSNAMFNDMFVYPICPCEIIRRYVVNFLEARKETGLHVPTTRVEQLIKWVPPPDGWVRLNSDGAAKANFGIVGLGGLLQDVVAKSLHGHFEGSISGFNIIVAIGKILQEDWHVEISHVYKGLFVSAVEIRVCLKASFWSYGKKRVCGGQTRYQTSTKETNSCEDILANLGCDLNTYVINLLSLIILSFC